MKKQRISQLAQRKLADLRKEGIDPTDEEILHLHRLGSIAEHGISDGRALLHQSITIGEVEIYPLTIGAKLWFEAIAVEWFMNDQLMLEVAFMYCAAHSPYSDKFKFKNHRKARDKITAWGLRVNLTEEQIMEMIGVTSKSFARTKNDAETIIRSLVAQAKENKGAIDLTKAEEWLKAEEYESAPQKAIPTITLLIEYFGKDYNYWLWEVSDDVCSDMLQQALQREKEKEDSDSAVDPHNPSVIAHFRLNKAAQEIRDSRNG